MTSRRSVALARLGLIGVLTLVTSSSAHRATPSQLNSGSLSRYLRPASKAELARCEAAARSVDLDVLCPLVLPKGQYDEPWCEDSKRNPCGYPCVFGVCFLAQVVFGAPHSYVGMGPGVGHFVVWATMQGRRSVVPCRVGKNVGSIESAGRKWTSGTVASNLPMTPVSVIEVDARSSTPES